MRRGRPFCLAPLLAAWFPFGLPLPSIKALYFVAGSGTLNKVPKKQKSQCCNTRFLC
jgi:hypothetical protein